MKFTDIFIFVVASFGEPVYYHMIKMRKLQLEKYNIPHRFLFDGPCPSDYSPDENDIFYEKLQEPFPIDFTVPYKAINPHMIIKFLKAIKDTSFDPNKYKFILRLNLSTFINFPLLLNKLSTTPTSRQCLSPDTGIWKTMDIFNDVVNNYYNKTCCEIHKSDKSQFQSPIEYYYKNKPETPCCDLFRELNALGKNEFYLTPTFCMMPGMIHIYTPDIIQYLSNISLDNPVLYIHNDDVVLSFLVQKYGCNYISIHSNHNLYALDQIMTRIKNPYNRMEDAYAWKYLLKNIDEITYDC